MNSLLRSAGRSIAHYLVKRSPGYEPYTPTKPVALREALRPGDVLLVEGDSRVSAIIKYLTQSTWSHSALYVGPIPGAVTADGEPHVLIEADIECGVVSVPLSKYQHFHTRICRPIGLSDDDCAVVCAYAIERVGLAYDTKNILDLMRYLVPLPVPQRWRRRMIALGSGDPTRVICSALIADAFNAVRYPILPRVTEIDSAAARREILSIRHSSLYTPRDFDISPYFEIVKPTILNGFNYKQLHWADLQKPRWARELAARQDRDGVFADDDAACIVADVVEGPAAIIPSHATADGGPPAHSALKEAGTARRVDADH